MLPLQLMTVPELRSHFAARARARRLDQNLTQQGLADRAGVSLSSLKRFERTGQVAWESLLKIAMALGALDDFRDLFKPPEFRTLDEVLAADEPRRKRGRIN